MQYIPQQNNIMKLWTQPRMKVYLPGETLRQNEETARAVLQEKKRERDGSSRAAWKLDSHQNDYIELLNIYATM